MVGQGLQIKRSINSEKLLPGRLSFELEARHGRPRLADQEVDQLRKEARKDQVHPHKSFGISYDSIDGWNRGLGGFSFNLLQVLVVLVVLVVLHIFECAPGETLEETAWP